MNILNIIVLAGGLAFFLYGMHVMSTGLEKMAGGKMEQILKKLTASPLRGLLLGAGITVTIQSSSALTVMLVGLVNSGIMEIEQTVGVIMGSNIGTTFTAWLLSLSGLEGGILASLLNPKYFSLVLALVGVFLLMSSKRMRRRDIGSILIGFAVLMYGMKMMGDAVEPLKDSPAFASLLTAFHNPLLGVLAGALITGILQSSSASVGLLQTLAMQTGALTYGMSIPIIMGQNIGTCITALISGISASRNARKVAVVHIFFNLIGTAFCLSLYLLGDAVFDFAFTDDIVSAPGIAAVHSVFNIVTTLLLFPFSKALVKLSDFVLPEKNIQRHDNAILDKRLLATPSVAVAECEVASVRMGELSSQTVQMSIALLEHYDAGHATEINANEEKIDRYEDRIGTSLVQLSAQSVSEQDSRTVSRILHAIGDFERLGDHAVNLARTAEEIQEKQLQFTPDARQDLRILASAVTEILNRTCEVYAHGDVTAAGKIEPLEQVIDELTKHIRRSHINRLKTGNCTMEMGFILSDLLTNFERISDHCSNIAVAVIETSHSAFETHRYLNHVRLNSPEFAASFSEFAKKYALETQ
jgi:phosphate:Na+ symporter